MRRLISAAAAAAFLALGGAACAEGITGPNGTCLLFCNSPQPAPSPSSATENKPAAAPRELHHRHRSWAAAYWERHYSRHAHAGTTAGWTHRPQVAAAPAPPHPAPARPQPVAATEPATPTPTAVATPAVATAANPTASAADLRAVADETSAPPTSTADNNAAQPAPNQATRLLAEAFSEQTPPAPTPAASPAPSPQAETVAPPPPPRPVAAAVGPRGFEFVEVTANGLIVPWWPANLSGRIAVWLAVLSAIAAMGLGVAMATSGRRRGKLNWNRARSQTARVSRA